ncbi:MAG TPA: metalloregulator ArsR/SmtB family transcription factor [Chloroflexota bacterium]|nr:metalloregulator ArsR/SmtB family transcription factor [Chloroflexota bacterium]HUM72536.1 metalloregulator ArsR/SmtB family transcription factor [Chloroflexota bacterium]
MSKSDYETSLEARAQLFKALGHPARLLIINLIQARPRHTEELAAILNLKPATVSHHLAQLTAVGLLTSEKEQYYQMYSLVELALQRSLVALVTMSEPGLVTAVAPDAYRDKVLSAFFRHGRLRRIPTQQKKRQVIMEKLVEEFEFEQDYTEQEVNRVLIEFHDDVATLRRELVACHLMTRADGIYRRVPAQ